MVDYAKKIADLRRLGAPGSGATEAERKLANDKAEELEAKYGKTETVKSPFTDDTTVSSRDGRGDWREHDPWAYDVNVSPGGFRFTRPNPKPGENPEFDRRQRQAWDELWNLHRQQTQWNPPPEEDDGRPDVDNIYEESFKYAENEDEGYEEYQ